MSGGEVFKLITPTPVRCCCSKTAFSSRGAKPLIFATFNTIIRHIFSENLIEIPQGVGNILRFSSSALTIFINFFEFFGISLLQIN